MFYTETATIKPEYEHLLTHGLITQRMIDVIFSGNPNTTCMLPFISNNVNKRHISTNPSTKAIDFLIQNPQYIDWDYISYNRSSNIGLLFDKYKRSINWNMICFNESSSKFLSSNLDRINWYILSSNESDDAIDLMEEYPENVCYSALSHNKNPRAINLLKDNLCRVNWVGLSSNPNALELLRENPDQIYWHELAYNPNPEALELMEENIENMNKHMMGNNPALLPWLRDNLEYVCWSSICQKAKTPEMFQFIRDHIQYADWVELSSNPYAGDLLKEFPNKITMEALYVQDVFNVQTTYNYNGIRSALYNLHQEYHAWAGHPSRIYKWKDWGMWENVLEEELDSEHTIEF